MEARLEPLRDIDDDNVPDWEYRSFILDAQAGPKGFMRAAAVLAPP